MGSESIHMYRIDTFEPLVSKFSIQVSDDNSIGKSSVKMSAR